MASESAFPESFRDPVYADLDAANERKYGLPEGLLSSVRQNGERSNHSAVSSENARTVYQFIPSTAKAIRDKYGIDVSLSPENASEGAALLLKEGLARNKGDPAAAVGEYVGGLDRSKWGPVTRDYVQRVTAGLPGATAAGAPAPAAQRSPDTAALGGPAAQGAPAPPAGLKVEGPSLFEQAQAAMAPKLDAKSIANVFAAYQDGRMSPQDASQFEADVKAGKMMLPRGASLKGAAPAAGSAQGTDAATGPVELPASVVQAYHDGRMAAADKAQLQADVQGGLVKLPTGMVLGQPPAMAQIPTDSGQPAPAVPVTTPQSLKDQAIGLGEAGLTALTGATGGALGMVRGTIGGLAEAVRSGQFGTPEGANLVERSAAQGAQDWTYAPRTPAGQQYAQTLGEGMQALLPIAPLAGETAALSAATQAAKPAVTATAAATGARVAEAAKPVTQAVSAAAGKVREVPTSVSNAVRTALGMDVPAAAEARPQVGGGSVGAAGTEVPLQRRTTAESLPVPIELTKGQAERGFEQQRFEQETAKNPSLGAPLREHYAEQNQRVLRNFDVWVDQTGAQAPNLRAVGQAVDQALVDAAARDKTQIRTAYKAAEKAGEMEAPVTLDGAVAHLNESAPDAVVTPLLDAARKRALRLGIAVEDANGELVAQPVPLRVAELYRRAIGEATDYSPTNVRAASIIKGLIDDATDGMGGDLYRQARALRSRFAQNYENRATIAKLLETKRGTSDRSVAFEDVFNHTILKGSLDDVRNVRRVMQRSGEDGAQAWRELQGATMNWLREEATGNVATDIRGNPIVSADKLNKALRTLDHDGKLDFIFGKQGAQSIRDINEIVKLVKTAPPGSVNTSNTASVLLTAMAAEAGATAALTGLPVPVLTGIKVLTQHMKDNRIRAKVREALGQAQRNQPPGAAAGATP